MAMHSTRLPILFSVAAITLRTSHGTAELNSTAVILPWPRGLRLSTTPGPPLVSSLGLRTMTYWLADLGAPQQLRGLVASHRPHHQFQSSLHMMPSKRS